MRGERRAGLSKNFKSVLLNGRIYATVRFKFANLLHTEMKSGNGKNCHKKPRTLSVELNGMCKKGFAFIKQAQKASITP